MQELRAAWLRLQQIQQIKTLEAMHAKDPSQLHADLLTSMQPESGVSAFDQLLARAQSQQSKA